MIDQYIDKNDIALILTLDANKKLPKEDGTFGNFLYEEEAVECVRSWRTNAGWLKDIKIYALCSTMTPPSQKTISKLHEYGVDYHYSYLDIGNEHPRQFLNTIYTQYYFSQRIPETIYIHIDLDMYVKAPLPAEWFDQSKQHIVFCRYTKNGSKSSKELEYRYNNINSLFRGECHNTYMIIANKNTGIASLLYRLAFTDMYKKFFEHYIYYRFTDDDYFFEEGLYDYAYINGMFKLRTTHYYDSEYIEANYFTHKHLTVADVVRGSNDSNRQQI